MKSEARGPSWATWEPSYDIGAKIPQFSPPRFRVSMWYVGKRQRHCFHRWHRAVVGRFSAFSCTLPSWIFTTPLWGLCRSLLYREGHDSSDSEMTPSGWHSRKWRYLNAIHSDFRSVWPPSHLTPNTSKPPNSAEKPLESQLCVPKFYSFSLGVFFFSPARKQPIGVPVSLLFPLCLPWPSSLSVTGPARNGRGSVWSNDSVRTPSQTGHGRRESVRARSNVRVRQSSVAPSWAESLGICGPAPRHCSALPRRLPMSILPCLERSGAGREDCFQVPCPVR